MALKGACASEGPRNLSFISFMVKPPICILNSKVDGLALCKEKTRHILIFLSENLIFLKITVFWKAKPGNV